MGCLENFLKNIDAYGENIEFTYRNKTKFTNCIGGFISLIVLVFLGYYLFFLISEISLKKNPTVVTSLIYDDIPRTIQLYSNSESLNNVIDPKERINKTAFGLSIGFREVSSNNFVDFNSSFVNLEMYLYTEKSMNNLKFKKCTKLWYLNQSVFDSFQLNKTYCLNDDIVIEGDRYTNSFKTLVIQVSKCKINCVDDNAIQTYLNNMKLEIYQIKESFNISNSESPISNKLEQFYVEFLSGYQVYVDYPLQIDKLISFESFFGEYAYNNFKEFYVTYLNYQNAEVNTLDTASPVYFKGHILSSKSRNVNTRKYLNILDQLSIIGGIDSVFLSFGLILTYFISHHRYDEAMINDFYNVIDPEKDPRTNLCYEDFLKERLIYIIKKFQNEKSSESVINPNIDKSYYNKTEFDRYFNQERILKIFEIKEDHDIFNTTFGSDHNNNKLFEDEYVNVLAKKNDEQFYKFKILYDVYKYEVNKDINLSYFEIFQKLCCRCFSSQIAKKRYEIIDTAVEKLNLDVDFISIVNGVKDFERITEIYFENYQSTLFNLSTEQISSENTSNKTRKTKNDLIKGFGFSLLKIIKEVNEKYTTIDPENYDAVEKSNFTKKQKSQSKNLRKSKFLNNLKNKQKMNEIRKRRQTQLKNSQEIQNKMTSEKNISFCCCAKKKKTSKRIFNELNDLFKFENLLDKLQSDGLSAMDIKMLKDLGVEAEAIVNFTAHSAIKKDVHEHVNNKQYEELKFDLNHNIIDLINKKFGSAN